MSDNQSQALSDEQRSLLIESLGTLPFARLLGMRLAEIELDTATVEIEMRDDLRQPSGVLHGGVTATLIDTAMAFAVRTRLSPEEPTATIDLTVHYLRPHVDGKFYCRARVVRAGRRIFTVAADVYGAADTLIATGISTYTRLS